MRPLPQIDFNAHPAEAFAAARQTGFFYLRNHPLPPAQIAEAFQQARNFFSLPEDKKHALQWTPTSQNCGYVGAQRERLGAGTDAKEAFNIGQATSLWPSDLPGFQRRAEDFQRQCLALSQQLLRLFAQGLELPAEFFTAHHQSAQDDLLRWLAYAPLGLATGSVRAGAHTDYGSLTLLFQDENAGLQIELANGDWLDVPPLADAILVNVGDLLQRWTGDRLRSAKHRVVDYALPNTRYSIAYFCHPDPETWIESLPDSHGAQYPAVQAGAYLADRIQASYSSAQPEIFRAT